MAVLLDEIHPGEILLEEFNELVLEGDEQPK
jgi:plasmid maintenance system antidote protein VapI